MANTETTINAVINPQINDAPIDIEKTIKALERNKFVVHYFETGANAVDYLQSRIQHKRVAIGDSRSRFIMLCPRSMMTSRIFSVLFLVKASAIPHYAPWAAMYFSPL